MAQSLTVQAAELGGIIYAQLQAQVGATTANVIVMALVLVAYAAVIGLFYKTFSKRNIIEVDWSKVGPSMFSQVASRVTFFMEYILLFPFATFVWFVLLTIFLFFMSKTGTISDMMFASISLVAATRVCAYFDEEIAADIAKMVPLAILGVFIVEPTMFSPLIVEQRLAEMADLIWDAIPYFWMLMALEVMLRILFLLKRAVLPEEKCHKAAVAPRKEAIQ